MMPEEHEGYVGNMDRFRNDCREEDSGTTGVAALKFERQFVGVEIDRLVGIMREELHQ